MHFLVHWESLKKWFGRRGFVVTIADFEGTHTAGHHTVTGASLPESDNDGEVTPVR